MFTRKKQQQKSKPLAAETQDNFVAFPLRLSSLVQKYKNSKAGKCVKYVPTQHTNTSLSWIGGSSALTVLMEVLGSIPSIYMRVHNCLGDLMLSSGPHKHLNIYGHSCVCTAHK